MTDLVPTSSAHPVTGEVIDLPALADDSAVLLLSQVIDLEARLREFKRDVGADLERRRRTHGSSAKGVQGGSLIAEKKTSRTWDSTAATMALQRLSAAGLVDPAEARALMPEVVKRKPDGRGLNSLLNRLVDAGELEAAGELRAARQEHDRWSVGRVAE